MKRHAAWVLAALLLAAAAHTAPSTPAELAAAYESQVRPRLALPPEEQAAYEKRLRQALAAAGVVLERPQFVLLVDRSAQVQAILVWWLAPDGASLLVGASPVSTGRPSGFEHFETPLGVFAHSLANPDFRAEGTKNEFGIRGYGAKGMRVFDFGWVVAARGWAPGEQAMRLQMHATDPDRLEPRLGRRESKGCIRIPATLNRLIDHHGLLDADYEAAPPGRPLWVLKPDRDPTPWSGRWLVVVDSGRSARPDWALPLAAAESGAPAQAALASCGSPG
ncbi:MAG: L,D-transpeptidase [Rubrivivax sp.]